MHIAERTTKADASVKRLKIHIYMVRRLSDIKLSAENVSRTSSKWLSLTKPEMHERIKLGMVSTIFKDLHRAEIWLQTHDSIA